jgi:hypothetical protein
MEAYAHPRTFPLFVDMLDAWDWWRNEFFAPFRRARRVLRLLRRTGALPLVARIFAWDLSRNLRGEVNALSYRTPDGMLSSALDWCPGRGGDQQHLWQATLGPDAVCFTTHPGPRSARSPGHWTGSACLPRVAQVENVAIALYRLHWRPAIYVANRRRATHAWLPRDRFDEAREQGGWFFARKGDGYLALRSQQPARWQTEQGEDRGRELIAEGDRHAWICELGRRASDGSFDAFAARVAAAPLRFERRRVVYESPSQGRLEFGWRGPLRRRGEPVPLDDFPRYASPWVRAPFPAGLADPAPRIEVRCGDEWLEIDGEKGERRASGFVW